MTIKVPMIVNSITRQPQPMMHFHEPSEKFLVYFQRTRMVDYRHWLSKVKGITTSDEYFAQRTLIF